jgi:hypothetical protein
MTFFQGRRWVVGNGCYHIVGDNLIHNSQETILMLGMTCYVVKVVKQEHEINNILLQCFNVHASFVFI